MKNNAPEWADVLEQRLIERIINILQTKRRWLVEEIVESGQAGWMASATEGTVRFVMSLTVPVEVANNPPAAKIEWTLVAEALREDRGQLRLPLAATMLGAGAALGGLAWHFRLNAFFIVIAALLGLFPIGLLLALVLLTPVSRRRARAPVPGAVAYLQEVGRAVGQLTRDAD
jgi:hypothetical protein